MLNFLYNFFFVYIHLTPPKPHAFVTNMLLSTAGPVKEPVNKPVPGRRCPSCLDKGETVWVIPGKDCPQCGTSVNRVAVEPGIALLYNVIQTLILLSLIIIIIVDNISYINACIVNLPDFLINVPLNILGYINACIVNLPNFLINLPNFNSCIDFCDAPRAWGLYFQDSASPQMEALVELHDNIMYYLTIILFGVGWIILSIVRNFVSSKSPISNKYLNHGTLIELIWTITPALILILIAFPSFKLLYLMDEVTDPSITLYAEGHQWYWSYQYPDFWSSDDTFIEFDSYLVPESDLEKGALRMLEVDNRVILPEITHTRFIVGAADVIHSFAIPALGIKCDAFPGRLNQVSVLINRLGTFYGQCSEICGILHSSMPIVVQSVSLEKFLAWLLEQ